MSESGLVVCGEPTPPWKLGWCRTFEPGNFSGLQVGFIPPFPSLQTLREMTYLPKLT